MKWNGRYYRPANGVPVYPKKEQSITELLKPLGEKIDKGNVWRPILNQPINVFKEEETPIPPVEFHLQAENNDNILAENSDFIDIEN